MYVRGEREREVGLQVRLRMRGAGVETRGKRPKNGLASGLSVTGRVRATCVPPQFFFFLFLVISFVTPTQLIICRRARIDIDEKKYFVPNSI